MRRKNWNALEKIERKQVSIASDNVSCKTTHSEFQKLIVLRITAGSYLNVNIDPSGLARQSRKETSDIFLITISTEAFSAQNFVEFGEYSERKQYLSSLQCQVNSMARLRIR